MQCLLELTKKDYYKLKAGEASPVLDMVRFFPILEKARYSPTTDNAPAFIAECVNEEITSRTSHLSRLEKENMVFEVMQTITVTNSWLVPYIACDMHRR